MTYRPASKFSWVALLTLLVVPLVLGLALAGLTSRDRTMVVEAAVVNLDQVVEIDGRIVPLGRQLAAEIIDREGLNVTWVLADEESAESRLAEGTYAAVVTIPEEFSAAATSFSDNDAAAARQATIKVAVSENSPITDAELAQEIAWLATQTINDSLTEAYLDNVYIGFNQVKERFETVVGAADQLADGGAQLNTGINALDAGAAQLNDGLQLMSDNSGRLVAGGDQLVSAGRQLAAGVRQYTDGAAELNGGVQRLKGELPQLVGGVQQLNDGSEALLGGLPEYVNGAKQAIQGVGAIQGGLDQVIAGIDQAELDFSQLDELAVGARQVSDGVNELNAEVQPYSEQLAQLADVLAELEPVVAAAGPAVQELYAYLVSLSDPNADVPPEVYAVAQQIKDQFTCPVADPATCQQLQETFNQGVDDSVVAGYREAAAAAAAALNAPDPNTGLTPLQTFENMLAYTDDIEHYSESVAKLRQLAPNLQRLADGADQVATGNEQLARELPGKLAENSAQLRGGLQQLSDGARLLSEQAQPIVANADQLSSGATELLGGIRELNTQVKQLPQGVNQLATGAAQLASGGADLAEGTRQYSAGVEQYVAGVNALADGSQVAAAASQQLSDGVGELSGGSTQLASGLDEFATGLAEGQREVPTYSESDRERLATVVSAPVVGASGLSVWTKIPAISLLLVVLLWLGALATFVVIRPIPADSVSASSRNVNLWLRTLRLPVAILAGQAIGLGVIGSLLLDFDFFQGFGLVALLVFLGVSFGFANHALAAWLGNTGRGIAMVLLAVTVGLGISSSVADWVKWLAAPSPLQNALLAVRTLLSSGQGLGELAGIAVLFALIAALISFAAISRNRWFSVAQFRRRFGGQ